LGEALIARESLIPELEPSDEVFYSNVWVPPPCIVVFFPTHQRKPTRSPLDRVLEAVVAGIVPDIIYKSILNRLEDRVEKLLLDVSSRGKILR
jgi:hypothetical protein